MNVGLYRGAVAMVTQARRLDTVSSNLANVGTVGFKRGATATRQVDTQRGNRKVRSFVVENRVDFSQGNLTRTGRDLDMALFGEGFFAIESPGGEVYSRDGSFHLTPDGVLVTEEGFPVAWDKSSGTIDPTGEPIYVDGQGAVTQGLNKVGRLRIVDFLDKNQLGNDPSGYWRAPAGLAEAAPSGIVHQYSLESSNVDGMTEMISMIEVQRAFESTSNVVSSIEQSYRRLTRPF